MTSSGLYRAIQAGRALTVDGGKVDAISTGDIAVWALGSISLNKGEVHAKGAQGYAAIGVRLTQADETAPTAKIAINQDYEEVSGGVIDVSELFASDSNFSSWTSFIAKNDNTGLATNMSNALNEVTIRIKNANYSKVAAAIAKVPTNLNLYTDATVKALNDAIAAVVEGKKITEQTTVDGYATAIENAIKALVKKGSSGSGTPSDTSDPTTPSTPDQNAAINNPQTGDNSDSP